MEQDGRECFADAGDVDRRSAIGEIAIEKVEILAQAHGITFVLLQ